MSKYTQIQNQNIYAVLSPTYQKDSGKIKIKKEIKPKLILNKKKSMRKRTLHTPITYSINDDSSCHEDEYYDSAFGLCHDGEKEIRRREEEYEDRVEVIEDYFATDDYRDENGDFNLEYLEELRDECEYENSLGRNYY